MADLTSLLSGLFSGASTPDASAAPSAPGVQDSGLRALASTEPVNGATVLARLKAPTIRDRSGAASDALGSVGAGMASVRPDSSKFGAFAQGLAGGLKSNADKEPERRKLQMSQMLGQLFSRGDIKGAASAAFASGDPSTGLKLFELARQQDAQPALLAGLNGPGASSPPAQASAAPNATPTSTAASSGDDDSAAPAATAPTAAPTSKAAGSSTSKEQLIRYRDGLIPALANPAMNEGLKAAYKTKIETLNQQIKDADNEKWSVVDPKEYGTLNIDPGFNGTVLKNVNGDIKFPGVGQQGISPQKIQSQAEQELSKAKVSDVVDAIGSAKPARDRLQTLSQLADAWNSGGNDITTGPLVGEGALKLKQIAKGMFGIDSAGLTQSELIQKVGTQLSAMAAKDLTSRPTQFDFKVFLANNPGLELSPGGNLALINLMQQKAKNDVQLAALARQQKNGDNWDSVVADFDKTHPIISPLTGKPLDPNEVVFPAPQKGGRGGQTAAQGQPQQAPQGAQDQPTAPAPLMPSVLKKAEGAPPDQVLAQAKDAIAKGAPVDAVAAHVRAMGLDPSALTAPAQRAPSADPATPQPAPSPAPDPAPQPAAAPPAPAPQKGASLDTSNPLALLASILGQNPQQAA
jgi:hypothetical protein